MNVRGLPAARTLIVAIDGPAGAGKSTAARRLALLLGCLYVDTGAMYRALTLKALREGTPFDDGSLGCLARQTCIRLEPLEAVLEPLEANGASRTDAGRRATCRVFLDGLDVTGQIRGVDVTKAVSAVSSFASVRERLVEVQREIARQAGRVVMDGRDIGTVVLPGADWKFFLTATIPERARRRRSELLAEGLEVSQAEIEEMIALRDELDSSRAVAPLRAAPGAVVIDSTGKTIDEVVQLMLEYCVGGRPL